MHPRERTGVQLYLASNSPRRRELLTLLGLDYDLLSTQVDETPFPCEDGLEYVKRIANRKATGAACQIGNDGVIIAADTAVVDHDRTGKTQILGKPKDSMEAVEMLSSLRGHTHQVFTAISILPTQGGTILSDHCATDVPMRNYGDEEIRIYVASGDPLDKAGAYAIQHVGFHPVEKLSGCFANVMGLPLCHLARSLSQLGINSPINVPQACQAALQYSCPVYHLILEENSVKLSLS